MSGGDDTEMAEVPTGVIAVGGLNAIFGSSDEDSSGDDEDFSTVARQNITNFKSKLGPVCYDLVNPNPNPNIRQFINAATKTGKWAPGIFTGSSVIEVTAPLIRDEITMQEPGVFGNPITGYGMICICKTPWNKTEHMAQHQARNAVTLIAKSVCITEHTRSPFKKRYPGEDQFVTIENIANFDHARNILSQGESGNHLVFVYFNTTSVAKEIKFNVSDLDIGKYFKDRLKYAFGMENETITIQPHTSITCIYGTRLVAIEYPGMDIESLPTNAHLWNPDHVLHWLWTKGLDTTFATVLTGDLIVMYKELSLEGIQDDMQCTREEAVELQKACQTVAGAAAPGGGASMDWQSAFTDLCIQR